MAATTSELAELHKLVATSLKQRIEQDMQDGVPTDAATLGAAIKFLKDNSITADPADADEITEAEHAALIEGQSQGKRIVADENGRPILQGPPPTPEQLMSRLQDRVQLWLDEQARALGYDDIKTAITYAEEPAVPKFQQEGQALRRLRSLAWARYYEIMDQVKAGQRAIPTEEELIADMEALK